MSITYDELYDRVKKIIKNDDELEVINKEQQKMLNSFFDNPDETMKQFLIEHPNFIEESLRADEKTAKRAKLLVENNLYGIN